MKMFDYYRPANSFDCPVCHVPLTEWMGQDGPCASLVWQQGIAEAIDQCVDDGLKLPLDHRKQLRLPPKFRICSYDCEVHCVRADCRAPDGVWVEAKVADAVDLRSWLEQGASGEKALDRRQTDQEVLAEWINRLMMEVNGGASFKQYLVWTPLEQISRIVGILDQAGLGEVAELTREAIRTAFPSSLPASDKERDQQVADFDEVQTQELIELAARFMQRSESITKALAPYGRKATRAIIESSLHTYREALLACGAEVWQYVIDRAASIEEVAEIEQELGRPLPPSLKEFATSVSRRIAFGWSLPEAFPLPEHLRGVLGGGLDYDIREVPEHEDQRQGWQVEVFPNASDPYDLVWHNKIAFHHIVNGDCLALDPSGQVIYLSHDEGAGHGYVMAHSFADFMSNWTRLGCPGPEDWMWLPFAASRESGIDPDCKAAKDWRDALHLQL